MLIMELFWSSATMVRVPLGLLIRWRPRSLPGDRFKPSRRVTPWVRGRSDMAGYSQVGGGFEAVAKRGRDFSNHRSRPLFATVSKRGRITILCRPAGPATERA